MPLPLCIFHHAKPIEDLTSDDFTPEERALIIECADENQAQADAIEAAAGRLDGVRTTLSDVSSAPDGTVVTRMLTRVWGLPDMPDATLAERIDAALPILDERARSHAQLAEELRRIGGKLHP